MTDTPMAPDQPTPVELTEQQIEPLIDAGNRALNDHYHEAQCHCDDWPASCVSSGHYFMGAWDTDAFAIGLPAVLGVWESLRNDQHAAKVAELRSDNEALRARVAELEEQERFQERNTLPDLHRQIEHHKDGKARWRKRAETAEARVAELEAAACRCFDPSHHAPDCKHATVVWNGVTYNAAAWYRDAEGVWWMACGIDGQGQPLMRVRADASNEPVPVSEVESDYGPLYRSDDGPDDLQQTETF